MRIGRGCRNCRYRHTKCVIRDGAQGCTRCVKVGRQCDLEPRFSFKNVHHIYQSTGAGRLKFDFSWDDQQVWVKVSAPLNFVLERCDSPDEWESNTIATDRQWGDLNPRDYGSVSENSSTTGASMAPTLSNNNPSTVPHEGRVAIESDIVQNHVSSRGLLVMTVGNALSSPINVERSRTSPSLNNSEVYSTSQSVNRRSSIVWNEPVAASSPNLPRGVDISLLSQREAFLLRSYIGILAPWCDVCDTACHFATEVPRRALEVPMVLYAVLAASSRHQAITLGTDEVEASTFHGRCLELLISVLSEPEETWDDNLLATVVILRIYEEFDNKNDEKCHLLGSNRLLNTVSNFSSSGGLAEAASWQFLRQAIYVSLVYQVPIELNLENYERSSVFNQLDTASYANVIIFLFAKALQLIYPPRGVPVDIHAWDLLQESVERWHNSKPSSFTPFHYQESSVEESRPFPELWMISPAAVVAMQYYHAARILLATHRPLPRSPTGFQASRLMRISEKAISTHLAIIVGLAVSNSTTENANFTACHALSAYGYCLRNPHQRQGAVSFLEKVERTMAWRTSWIIDVLEEQWKELDGLNADAYLIVSM
ncbi:hypothetical protein VTN00DRAFT_5067 [Thermoascus crustaceus]|uniref:uncharacterized protein n=1 Tax=Thermoascus crustaceus TaxID=5088 RepID=UPI00374218FC